MKTKYSISNFRVFDSKGASLDIEPITILTGCNSSGKSSVVKSMLLLDSFLSSVRNYSGEGTPRLDFSKRPLSLLGNFESVLNRQSSLEGGKQVSFSYTVNTPYLGGDACVTLSFSLDEHDPQKNGFLERISIKDSDDVVFYSGGDFGASIRPVVDDDYPFSAFPGLPIRDDLSSLKRHFFASAIAITALRIYWGADGEYSLGNISKQECDKRKKKAQDIVESFKPFISLQTAKALIKVYSYEMGSKFPRFDKQHLAILEKAVRTGILFYLPILEHLDRIPVSSFRNEFLSLCKTCSDESKNRCVNFNQKVESILSGFEASGAEKFSSYYLKLEELFFNGSYEREAFSDEQEILSDSYPDSEMDSDGEIRDLTPKEIEESMKNRKKKAFGFKDVFMVLCDIDPEASSCVRKTVDPFCEANVYSHELHKVFESFRQLLLKDILTFDTLESLAYVSSSRIDVKRLYGLETGDDFSHTASNFFEELRLIERHFHTHDYIPYSFINKWLRAFEIGDRLALLPMESGSGFIIRVYETPEDQSGRLLADFGYGISQLVSILLEIETAIIKHARHAIHKKTIAIEEPEIHLHPDFQALLANMFYEAYCEHGIHFIIETHSEYLVRRIQLLFAELPKDKENPFAVFYFPKGQAPYKMEFTPSGHFDNKFGPGFYDAAATDALKLSRLARQKNDE